MGQIRANEFTGDGKDQARLIQRIEWAEEIGKHQAGFGIRKRRHRGLYSVAGKIDPFQEVSDLVSPNRHRDFQHFQTADFLAKRLIEARSTLFDISKVKTRHIRDRLNMDVPAKAVRIAIGEGSALKIGIGSGNGGNPIESERLREGGAEVWIGCAAVAN